MSVYTRIIANPFSRYSDLGRVLGWMRQRHAYARLGGAASRPVLSAAELLSFHKRELSRQFLRPVFMPKCFGMKLIDISFRVVGVWKQKEGMLRQNLPALNFKPIIGQLLFDQGLYSPL